MSEGNLFDLTGKTAIVTGGGRGLGKAIAIGLAGAGADVVVASRKVENCEAVAREIEASGRRALAVGCHVGPHRPDRRARRHGVRGVRAGRHRGEQRGDVAGHAARGVEPRAVPEDLRHQHARPDVARVALRGTHARTRRRRDHQRRDHRRVPSGCRARPVLLVEGRAARADARDGQGMGRPGVCGSTRSRPDRSSPT